MNTTVTIERLGALGDGIATVGGKPVYVEGALPGEVVEIDDQFPRPTLLDITSPSPDRVTPDCPYFEACGGCVAQHMPPAIYRNWKRSTIETAFTLEAIEISLSDTLESPVGSRRRAVFSAEFVQGKLRFGFSARRSHDLADIRECLVLDPEITSNLNGLKELAGVLIQQGERLRVSVLASQSGLDVSISDSGTVSRDARLKAINHAISMNWARLTVEDEVFVETRAPILSPGGCDVVPPPGGFSQATKAAEDQMVELVLGHLGKSRHAIDLFSGFGTFSLPLAEHSRVHAVELEGAALANLETAARSLPGLKPVTIEQRDLFRRPVLADELKPFDFAVIDPPRAGAEAQTKALAKSSINRIAFVSCNPTTLARDAEILLDAGFGLEKLIPIDQFLYSAHVELVAHFSRKKARKRPSIFG
ncbi:MAG: TRAM domain-containing protein [Pseudomonadota bacterium]